MVYKSYLNKGVLKNFSVPGNSLDQGGGGRVSAGGATDRT